MPPRTAANRSLRTICVIRRAAALGCAVTVRPFIDRDSSREATYALPLRYVLLESPVVGARRMMMVMHSRDFAHAGMIALCVFARRVVRSMPTADVATRNRGGVRSGHRDGMRSAMAAERTAAMSTSTGTAAAMATASASTTAAAAGVATATTAATTATATRTSANRGKDGAGHHERDGKNGELAQHGLCSTPLEYKGQTPFIDLLGN